MMSNEEKECPSKFLVEHLEPIPGPSNCNFSDQQSNPGPSSCGVTGPVQYIQQGSDIYPQIPENLIEKYGNNIIVIYSVPVQDNSDNVGCGVKIHNSDVPCTEAERICNYSPQFSSLSPEKYELSEKDVQDLTDHLSGKKILGSNFLERLQNMNDHFHVLLPSSIFKQKQPKYHPWTKWVGTRCPKVEPKSYPKFRPRSRRVPTWQESDPMRIYDSSNSETEAEDLPSCAPVGKESDTMGIYGDKNSEPRENFPNSMSTQQQSDSSREQAGKSTEAQDGLFNKVSTFQESEPDRIQDGKIPGMQAIFQTFCNCSNCAKFLQYSLSSPSSSQP